MAKRNYELKGRRQFRKGGFNADTPAPQLPELPVSPVPTPEAPQADPTPEAAPSAEAPTRFESKDLFGAHDFDIPEALKQRITQWEALAGNSQDAIVRYGASKLVETGAEMETNYRALIAYVREQGIPKKRFTNLMKETAFPASRISEFARLIYSPDHVLRPYLERASGFRLALKAARSSEPKARKKTPKPDPKQVEAFQAPNPEAVQLDQLKVSEFTTGTGATAVLLSFVAILPLNSDATEATILLPERKDGLPRLAITVSVMK